jgi:hypothetical protein
MISSTASIAKTNTIAALIYAERGSRGHDDSEYEDNPLELRPHCEADHEGYPHGTVFPRIADAPEQPPDCRSALHRRTLACPQFT